MNAIPSFRDWLGEWLFRYRTFHRGKDAWTSLDESEKEIYRKDADRLEDYLMDKPVYQSTAKDLYKMIREIKLPDPVITILEPERQVEEQ